MGKDLIQQRRGGGSQRYVALSRRYVGEVKHARFSNETKQGEVLDIVNSVGHYAPIAKVKYQDEDVLLCAPDGIKVGDVLETGPKTAIKPGNTLELKNVPEGTLVFNIESQPGDGGKFCRTSGTFARIVTKTGNMVTLLLPSKKERKFSPGCRATVGVVAGSGRTEKPMLKAGKMYFARRARNKMYPSVSGNSMNAVDHPFGGHSSHRHNQPRQSSRNAPPGRKVGSIAPRRTGWRRGS